TRRRLLVAVTVRAVATAAGLAHALHHGLSAFDAARCGRVGETLRRVLELLRLRLEVGGIRPDLGQRDAAIDDAVRDESLGEHARERSEIARVFGELLVVGRD